MKKLLFLVVAILCMAISSCSVNGSGQNENGVEIDSTTVTAVLDTVSMDSIIPDTCSSPVIPFDEFKSKADSLVNANYGKPVFASAKTLLLYDKSWNLLAGCYPHDVTYTYFVDGGENGGKLVNVNLDYKLEAIVTCEPWPNDLNVPEDYGTYVSLTEAVNKFNKLNAPKGSYVMCSYTIDTDKKPVYVFEVKDESDSIIYGAITSAIPET